MEATFQELLTELRDLSTELAIAALDAHENDAEFDAITLQAVSCTLDALAERYAAENRRQWSKHYAEIAAA